MNQNHNSKQNNTLDNAVVVAITGGIASGKSEVAKIISKKNYPIISTDLLAKDLMNNDISLKKKLINEFGEDIYFLDGKLNSKKLSEIVFSTQNESKKIKKLNSIVHPIVIDKMIETIESLITNGNRLIFVESALVYESGLDAGFDYIITISSDYETRINRAMTRTNLSREEIIARINEQISQEEKIRLSDFEIENNKSIKELEDATILLLSIIEFLPPKTDYSFSTDGDK